MLFRSTAYTEGIKEGDLILSVDSKKINTFDDLLLETRFGKIKDEYTFEIERDNQKYSFRLHPEIKKDEEGNEYPVFGVTQTTRKNKGIMVLLEYKLTITVEEMNSCAIITEQGTGFIIEIFSWAEPEFSSTSSKVFRHVVVQRITFVRLQGNTLSANAIDQGSLTTRRSSTSTSGWRTRCRRRGSCTSNSRKSMDGKRRTEGAHARTERLPV